MNKRIEHLLKHNLLIQKLYSFFFSSFFRIIGVFIRTDDHLVLLNSFGGKGFNDSPKVLFEYMLNDRRFAEMKYVWAFEHPDLFSIPNCKKVNINSFAYFFTALKSKYWITNVNIERGLHFKKRKTRYLNTWHGTGPKVGGNAVTGRKDYDFSRVDVLCADGDYLKSILIRDYKGLSENIVLFGRPREDELYNMKLTEIEKWKRDLRIPENKKIILYAPTWRESNDLGNSYSLDIPVHMNEWRSRLQEKYVILFRAHNITNSVTGIIFDDFCINVSDYPNINHLYAISDILISDYSSVFLDYAILEKPIICYAYDYQKYCKERGLYYDMEIVFPGGVLKTENEVIDRIIKMDFLEEKKKTIEYRNRFIARESNATEKCLIKLFNLE